MNKLVSIIIPTYNSAKYIQEAVDSVLAQTYSNIEIIVVDDGSFDETKLVLRPYIEKSKIKYFYQSNKGPAIARNVGIKNSKGEFIALIDSDDIWMAEKLEKQMVLFEKNEVGVVYSRQAILDQKNNLYEEKNINLFRGNITKELIRSNFIPHSSAIIRKTVFDNVGGYSEDKAFLTIEDYELWFRICLKYEFDYVDSVLVYHRSHENQFSRSSIRTNRCLGSLYKKLLFDKNKNYKLLLLEKYFRSKKEYLRLKFFKKLK